MASSLNSLMAARRLQLSTTSTNTMPIPSPLSNSGFSYHLFSRSQLYPIVIMLFIIAILTLYLKHCWTPTPHPFPAQNNTMMTATAPDNRILPSEGLDGNLVASFPLVQFPLQQRQNIKRESCAICLTEYRSGDSLLSLPCCGCLFHPQCIKSWFNSHTTCPLCRCSLTTISQSLPHHSSSASPQPMAELVPSVEPLNLQVEPRWKASRKLRRWHSMDNRSPQLLLLTKSGGSHDSSSPLSISNTTSWGTSDNPSSSHDTYGKIHPHMKDMIGDNSSTKYLSRSSSDKLMMRRKDRDGEGSSSSVATMPFSLSPSSSSMKKRNPTRFAIHNK